MKKDFRYDVEGLLLLMFDEMDKSKKHNFEYDYNVISKFSGLIERLLDE